MSKPLGRGISALIGENQYAGAAARGGAGEKSAGIATLPVEKCSPGAFQPRQHFSEEALNDLAESIRRNGIVQPVIVRRGAGENYEIIAGERRWRAAQIAGLREIPAIVREFTDREALEVALIENIQRQDLTPLEVAEGYQRLIEQFGYTQEALAEALGKSRSQVTNQLRLLTLPGEVRAMLGDGRLSAGHARALVGSEYAVQLASLIVKRGLNVRQTEKLAQDYARYDGRRRAPRIAPLPEIQETERALTRILGMPVSLAVKGPGRGAVSISYQTSADFEKILGLLYSCERTLEKAQSALEPVTA